MLEKDTVVAIGVVFTAFIGLLNLGYSFRHNRELRNLGHSHPP